VTAFTQAGLLNRIHLPSDNPELTALADNLSARVSALAQQLPPSSGFSGILLALTPAEAYGTTFFQTENQAVTAAATVSSWWKLQLAHHVNQVDAATVFKTAGVNPDARMVWAPAPTSPAGSLLALVALPGGVQLRLDQAGVNAGNGGPTAEKVG
jgi:hypothetical protein